MGNSIRESCGFGAGRANPGNGKHIDVDARGSIHMYMLLYTYRCLHIDVYIFHGFKSKHIDIDAFWVYTCICFHLYLYAFIYMYMPTFVA